MSKSEQVKNTEYTSGITWTIPFSSSAQNLANLVTLKGEKHDALVKWESLLGVEGPSIRELHAIWMNLLMQGKPLPESTSLLHPLEQKAMEGFQLGLQVMYEHKCIAPR